MKYLFYSLAYLLLLFGTLSSSEVFAQNTSSSQDVSGDSTTQESNTPLEKIEIPSFLQANEATTGTFDSPTNQNPSEETLYEELPAHFMTSYQATCSPHTSRVEIGEEVTWTQESIGVTDAYWEGETIQGSRESSVVTRYGTPGEQTVFLYVKPTFGSYQKIPCGSVLVVRPPLTVTCSPDAKFIEPQECVTWSANITSNDPYTLEWSGHSLIQGKSQNSFSVCYATEGYYLGDLTVSTTNEERTLYCGGVTVSEKPTSVTSLLSSKPTKGYTTKNGILEGSCQAQRKNGTTLDKITWEAELNQSISSRGIVWHGDELEGLAGEEQTVTYSSAGIKTAAFSVRSESGELYRFPCAHDVEILEATTQDELWILSPQTFIDWIRLIILVGILSFWITVLGHVLRKKK